MAFASLDPSAASYGFECRTYIMAITGNISVETVKEDWPLIPCIRSTRNETPIVP